MPQHTYIVNAGQHGTRLDAFLATCDEVASRAQAARLIEDRQVQVNGQVVTAKRRVLLKDDAVVYNWQVAQPRQLLAEAMALDIRYEDDYLIVLSKPAGLCVHPSRGHEQGTLVNALIAHCGYGNLAQLQGDDRPGVVHRLDQDTSGLMLAAKDDQAGLLLQQSIRLRELDRRYLTLVHGNFAVDNGLIDAPLARSLRDRVRYEVSPAAKARSAVTSFTVLQRFDCGPHDDGYTLLECKLFSGRTHQIRAHMAYTQHPCVGDPLYGPRRRPQAELGLTGQFLHSCLLEFTHPVTHQQMSFADPLPMPLMTALDKVRDRSCGITKRGEELAWLFAPSEAEGAGAAAVGGAAGDAAGGAAGDAAAEAAAEAGVGRAFEKGE
ncbi:MAG: RluA family pseudouridine synthase [Coriobacteriia bacterium]|nr:RluA family pseudouridine synthase [Coriobacteriia bacterium]